MDGRLSDAYAALRRRLSDYGTDAIVASLVFAATLALFLWTALPQVVRGLGHGDDAYVALAAKSLADGRGYGVPWSSSEFRLFDPNISTGVPLVVPLAFMIELFGLRDRLPAAVATVVVLAQIGVLTLMLRRRFGSLLGLTAVAAVLLLLIVGTRAMRLQGVFMGEPAAFLFVMIAIVGAAGSSARTYLGAGLAAGLAVLTKLIAAYAVAGLFLAWLVLEWLAPGARRDRRGTAALFAGAALPVAAFEAVKLWNLGVAGYVDNWRLAFSTGGALGSAVVAITDFPGEALANVFAWYIAPLVLVVVAITFLGLARFRPSSGPAPNGWARMFVLVCGALFVHWLYMATRGSILPRYLYLGVLLALVLLALLALRIRSRERILALAVVPLAWLALDPGSVPLAPRFASRAAEHTERLAAVQLLQDEPAQPYVADYWASVMALVFLRADEGAWASGADAWRFAGRPIFLVYIRPSPGTQGEMTRAAQATCADLMPGSVRTAVLDCGVDFWAAFMPTGVPTSDVPAPLSGAQVRPVTGCNVDYLANASRADGFLEVTPGAVVPMNGWTTGPTTATATEIYLELRSEDGEVSYTPAAVLERSSGEGEAGFRAAIDFTGVANGTYELGIVATSGDQASRCDTRLDMRLVASPADG